MKERKFSLGTILLWCALTALCVAGLMIAPKTIETYNQMVVVQNATPTPTADVRSMFQVTIDPATTPAPTVYLLQMGTKGDEVKRLQEVLFKLQYYTGEIDGQYGAGTADAVLRFQNQHQLLADGITGEETRKMLFSKQAQTYIPTPVPTASPTPAPTLAPLVTLTPEEGNS